MEDTMNFSFKNKIDTSTDGNYAIPMLPDEYFYNRKVRRYAKKHNVSLEKAFKGIYK